MPAALSVASRRVIRCTMLGGCGLVLSGGMNWMGWVSMPWVIMRSRKEVARRSVVMVRLRKRRDLVLGESEGVVVS